MVGVAVGGVVAVAVGARVGVTVAVGAGGDVAGEAIAVRGAGVTVAVGETTASAVAGVVGVVAAATRDGEAVAVPTTGGFAATAVAVRLTSRAIAPSSDFCLLRTPTQATTMIATIQTAATAQSQGGSRRRVGVGRGFSG